MSDYSPSLPALCHLEDFASLRLRGPDTRRFLQGQLSNDLQRLSSGVVMRAGLHNPQGRTLALLWLLAAGEDVIAVLPRELAPVIAAQLRRFVLRAKVTISEEGAQSRVVGWRGPGGAGPPEGFCRYDLDRAIGLLAADATAPVDSVLSREQWRALDVARGQPQVYPASSGMFIAQMLNLDCIDAISFEKGCYTGQEVIARAHFRGRVKRRMQRFVSVTPVQLSPSDAGRLEDGRTFRVVEAVARADGRCEFLAVAPLEAAGAADEPVSDGAAAPMLAVESLALPYALPA